MATEHGEKDPFNFSVDQTISALSPYLDAKHVESLRYNEVTGSVLLKTATLETLKTELRIIPLGRRQNIMDVVGEMKRSSAGWRDYILKLARSTPLPWDAEENSHEIQITPLNVPNLFPADKKRKRKDPSPTSSGAGSPTVSKRFLVDSPATPRRPSLPPINLWNRDTPLHVSSPFRNALNAWVNPDGVLVKVPSDGPSGAPTISGGEPFKPKAESGGLNDAMGDMNEYFMISTESTLPPKRSDEPAELAQPTGSGESSGPKRIAPITIAPVRELKEDSESEVEPTLPPTARKRRRRGAKGYLPQKAHKVENIFYDVEVGADIPLDFDDEDDFIIHPEGYRFPGEQRYIAGQIRRLLKDNGRLLADFSHQVGFSTDSAEGKFARTQFAVKHYEGEKYLRKWEHPSFTVFDIEQSGSTRNIRAHRESTRTLSLPWSSRVAGRAGTYESQVVRHADKPTQPQLDLTENSLHDWDYLLKWQNIDGADEVLPLFGESGDEWEYDEPTWREMLMEAKERPQKAPGTKRLGPILTQAEIEEAITNAIGEIIQKWQSKILPKKEATAAYRLWTRAKKQRKRKRITKMANRRIHELDKRLESLKAEILKPGMNWTNKDHVRKQARGSMELSVSEREEQRWLVELLQRTEEPLKPQKKTSHINGSTIDEEEQSDNKDDGESIGSDSDDDQYLSDDENVHDMTGFIIPDAAGDEDVLMKDVVNEEASNSSSEDDDEDEDGHAVTQHQRTQLESTTPEIKDELRTPYSATKEIIDLTFDTPPKHKIGKLVKKMNGVTVIDLEDEDDSQQNTMGLASPVPQTPKTKEQLQDELIERLLYKDGDSAIVITENIYHRFKDISDEEWFPDISQALGLLTMKRMPGISPHEETIRRITCRLYISWTLLREDVSDSPRQKLREEDLSILRDFENYKRFTTSVKRIVEEHDTFASSDSEENSKRLENGKHDLKQLKSSLGRKSFLGRRRRTDKDDDDDEKAEEFLFDEVDGDDAPNDSQHRKRKRKAVVEDLGAKGHREHFQNIHKNIQRRMKEREKRGGDIGEGKVVINPGKFARDADIFIEDEIARKLKPHQVSGIRFLWNQLVQSSQENSKNSSSLSQGALLAHTMGLGKTLQVITFIYTLATAGDSDNEAVYRQIPKNLRLSKTLILSPPGLVDNWWDELHNWLPFDPETGNLSDKYIGKIYRADAQNSQSERLTAMNEWNKNGGVLLIGYHMFRDYVINEKKKLSENEAAAVRKILLQGPNVIVADEAHQLKNPKSKTTMAAVQFRSKSRIAMTGSPLSNHLQEYWSMIEWIDPGYLGPLTEFNRKYVYPISDGLYADSSQQERRISLKMLRVLKNDIAVKIHRADIDVIKNEMPPKTEFLITVPLTELQSRMYKAFIMDPTTTGSAANVKTQKTSGTAFFNIVNLLSLICGHPAAFVRILKEREAKRQRALRESKQTKQTIVELSPQADVVVPETEDPLEEIVSQDNEPYKWAFKMLEDADGEKIDHSYRMLVFRDILRYSVALKEKVLVFSHSISTLDLLEQHVKDMGIDYLRLDGKTPMEQRQRSAKAFNAGVGNRNVFLVSTEAGGLGLNLPGANRVIIFDFKWSPMWESQAVGRAYRLGQQKHVFVYRFRSGGTYEDNMWNTVQFKSQLQSRVVDSKAPIREAHKKMSEYLAQPTEPARISLDEFKGLDKVLDRVIADNPHVRGVEYTETFVPDSDDALTEEEKKEADLLLEEAIRARKMHAMLPDPGPSVSSGPSTGPPSSQQPSTPVFQPMPYPPSSMPPRPVPVWNTPIPGNPSSYNKRDILDLRQMYCKADQNSRAASPPPSKMAGSASAPGSQPSSPRRPLPQELPKAAKSNRFGLNLDKTKLPAVFQHKKPT